MSATKSLYGALFTALSGNEMWGDRVYPEIVPAKIIRPYVVYFISSGGERNARRKDDATFTVVTKCVSLQLSESMDGAGRLSEILNNAGAQGSGEVSGDDQWVIMSIEQMQFIKQVEMINDDQPLFHTGHMFRFNMEKI